MPRKKRSQSKFTVTPIFDSSEESLKSLDNLNMNELKIIGRGNRSNIAGIGQLLNALGAARPRNSRFKSIYLNIADLQNQAILNSLESLGILQGVLTQLELDALRAGSPIPAISMADLNEAAEHYMEQAIKYL
jgi:hypothetical protein